MNCNLCGYSGDFIKIYDVDGTRVRDAECYKGKDYHHEIRNGINIHECPQCSEIKKFKRATAKVTTKKKDNIKRVEVTELFVKDTITLLKELRGAGITSAENKKINNQIKRAEYYLKK